MTPNEKIVLAALAAGAGIYASTRFRSDLPTQVAMVIGFGVAQWLATSAHTQRYPDVPAPAPGGGR